jgi:hypothetical protein
MAALIYSAMGRRVFVAGYFFAMRSGQQGRFLFHSLSNSWLIEGEKQFAIAYRPEAAIGSGAVLGTEGQT